MWGRARLNYQPLIAGRLTASGFHIGIDINTNVKRRNPDAGDTVPTFQRSLYLDAGAQSGAAASRRIELGLADPLDAQNGVERGDEEEFLILTEQRNYAVLGGAAD